VTAVLPPLEAADHFLASVEKPARLLVAISGGSDSTGLLLVLNHLLGQSGLSDISLVAATIDHALRPASADEARAVAALCQKLGIPHIVRRWDGAKPKSGLSMAAREARYRLLGEVADAVSATAIVTGHTSDDQAETIAMRSARSDRADDAGLAGMADAVLVDRRHWVLRPLLQSRRADIRSFLRQREIGWIDDPSNEDPHYERARTRLQLAAEGETRATGAAPPAAPFVNGDPATDGDGPLSAQGQGPAPAATGADRRQALSDAAALLLQHHACSFGATVVKIAAPGLAGDPAILRHALAHLTAVIGGRSHPPGRDGMDRVLDFVASGRPGRITAGRVMFDRRRDALFLLRENRDLPRIELATGAKTVWDGRVYIDNPLPAPIIVAAAAASAPVPDFAMLPSGIATRAARILPRVEMSEGGDDVAAMVPQQPALGPYDRFLPRFDLALANQIAALLGRAPYPLPPC
jgi:tRNA(Ile)-lysidine synthase